MDAFTPGDLAASRRVWKVQFGRTRLSLRALGGCPSESLPCLDLRQTANMLTLQTLEAHVVLRDEPTYTPRSTDNVRTYGREIVLLDQELTRSSYISSRHGVVAKDRDGHEHSCVLLGGAGATTIHEHSVVLRSGALYVACADTLCALSLPVLQLRWWRRVDPATCFGVHELPEEGGLISHGELSISRVSLAGEILWSATGEDIFTGPLTLLPDRVRVVDWNGTAYSFALSDGRPVPAPA
jgi:hypothetical protein